MDDHIVASGGYRVEVVQENEFTIRLVFHLADKASTYLLRGELVKIAGIEDRQGHISELKLSEAYPLFEEASVTLKCDPTTTSKEQFEKTAEKIAKAIAHRLAEK